VAPPYADARDAQYADLSTFTPGRFSASPRIPAPPKRPGLVSWLVLLIRGRCVAAIIDALACLDRTKPAITIVRMFLSPTFHFRFGEGTKVA
jgi:hypothetical protein